MAEWKDVDAILGGMEKQIDEKLVALRKQIAEEPGTKNADISRGMVAGVVNEAYIAQAGAFEAAVLKALTDAAEEDHAGPVKDTVVA